MKMMLEAGAIRALDPQDNFLARWKKQWASARLGHWSAEPVLRACEQLSRHLAKGSVLHEQLLEILVREKDVIDKSEGEAALAETAEFLLRANLERKIQREFKERDPFVLRRLRDGSAFEAWCPLGVLVHVSPSNAPTLPFLALVEGLVTGNINVLKLSGSSSLFTVQILSALAKADASGVVAPLLYAAPISSGNRALLQEIFAAADGISAWGSEEAIHSIRALAPPSVRFIAWGHKISFAYVAASRLEDEQTKLDLARSISLLDQQACSSPQCVFLETDDWDQVRKFAQSLATALDQVSPTIAGRPPADAEAAEITKVVQVHEAETCLREALVLEAKDHSWRILADREPGLRASPLFRSIFLKPLLRSQILEQLRPMRVYLQTAGLACSTGEIAELSILLEQSGVQRIRAVASMLEGYAGEPHDGVYALEQFVKRISVVLPELDGFNSFSELERAGPPMGCSKPILNKEGFQSLKVESCDLYFKSGGSSGAPKFSAFAYRDYHEQMRYAADGLVAAGLDPAKDLCMNLFFAGGLYGGFLSFFTILEDLRAKQLPMAAHPDLAFVGDMIVERKVDVLLGMPSYLEQLFRANHEKFARHRPVRKIFYGGEHFTAAQRLRYQQDYGVELIRSATYGSVDAGPLGYQCSHCEGSVHHLHTALQNLEILELDQDVAVARGEIGRLVFSSKKRIGMSVERYDIGDLGRELLADCPCGRKSPLFELMGRHGDVFRAGGSYLNYNTFQRVLEQDFSYGGELQIVLSSENGVDQITLHTDRSIALDTDAFLKHLLRHYKDLQELVAESTLKVICLPVDNSHFSRTAGSGKLLRILDKKAGKR